MRGVGVRRWPAVLALAAGMVAGVVVAVLFLRPDDPAPPAPPKPTTVPVADLDLSGLAAVRAPFCEALDPTALSDLLGRDPRRRSTWSPGDRVRLEEGLVDVADEYGCSFVRRGVTARAWLFAQPVSRREAGGYVEERRRTPGCRAAGVLSFGSPGVVQACRVAGKSPARVVAMAGRFGDGWLTCEVTAAPASAGAGLIERAQRWCAAVATTVAATPGATPS